MPIRPIACAILIWTAGQGSTADFLDVGVAITSRPSFERSKNGEETIFHFSQADSSSAEVTMNTKRGFPTVPNESISSRWARVLSEGRIITLRLANRRKVEPGTAVRGNEDLLTCVGPSPFSRDERKAMDALRCVAFDKTRLWRSETGELKYEIDIAILVPNESALDSFLRRPRNPQMILARVE